MNYAVAAGMTHGPLDQIEATAIDRSAAKCMGQAEPYAAWVFLNVALAKNSCMNLQTTLDKH